MEYKPKLQVMSKRQREKQDGSYTGLSRTDRQLGSAKKLKVSSRSRLRSSRQETCTNNSVTSSYTSPGCSSKLLAGHSPICSTPQSSRKRLNTSRSDSETEIIWDANSPTAHLMRRSGRNGRSKAGEISEMIKCVKNQAETSPAHFPLLGLWTHRSPLNQQELNSDGGSEKAFRDERSTLRKPMHRKKKAIRLSLIQDELQKIANAINTASKHETSPSPDTAVTHDPATGFITPPRHKKTEELTGTVDGELLDGDTSPTNARPEPDGKLNQPELTLRAEPPCLQSDTTQLLGDQVNTRQRDQPPTSQSASDQMDSVQPLVGTSSSVICQSVTSNMTPNVDIMWDDDSYFEDEALLEQLTQTEAMEASRSQHGDVSKKKTTQNNLSLEVCHHPPTHSTNSLRQPRHLVVTSKTCTESVDVQQKSQTFPGTFPRPTTSDKTTAANQTQHSKRSTFKAVNGVKDTCPNQGKKQSPLKKPLKVKPPPPAQETTGKPVQHQVPPSYKTHKSLPAHPDDARQQDVHSAKSNQAKPPTSSCPQLRPTANASGQNSNSQTPITTASKLQLSASSSWNASSSIQGDWDNVDPFESSLTDEVMMSLCVGIDSPQTSKPTEQILPVQFSKPCMSTKTAPTQYEDKAEKAPSRQNQNAIKSSTTTTSSTTTYKFRKPVRDMSRAVSHSTNTALAGKCSANTSFVNQPFTSTTGSALAGKCSANTSFVNQPYQSTTSTERNVQPVNNTIRHQPTRLPKSTHQLPQSSKSGVLSLTTPQPAVPSSVSNAARASSTKDSPASYLYSKPASAKSTSNKTFTAQSTGSFQTRTSSLAKSAVLSTSKDGSHKVCSQTEIERKRQQAKARLQQHRAGSQQHRTQQR